MGEMIKVTMPKWGLSMVKGTVNDWVVEEGEEVEKGQELVEIETDKIANVLESPGEGVLYLIVAQPGEVLPVSALLGVITQGRLMRRSWRVTLPKHRPQQRQQRQMRLRIP